jgi:hypothetical protein
MFLSLEEAYGRIYSPKHALTVQMVTDVYPHLWFYCGSLTGELQIISSLILEFCYFTFKLKRISILYLVLLSIINCKKQEISRLLWILTCYVKCIVFSVVTY